MMPSANINLVIRTNKNFHVIGAAWVHVHIGWKQKHLLNLHPLPNRARTISCKLVEQKEKSNKFEDHNNLMAKQEPNGKMYLLPWEVCLALASCLPGESCNGERILSSLSRKSPPPRNSCLPAIWRNIIEHVMHNCSLTTDTSGSPSQ